jgi:uncharacterized membrane protein
MSKKPAQPAIRPKSSPPPVQGEVTQQTQIQHVSFQGPIPPPDALAGYERIQTGLADRIVRMAEEEQRQRHQLESEITKRSFDEARRGQNLGFAIGTVAIIAGALTATAGASIPGSIIGGGGVIGLVAVFVLGRFFPTGK